MLNCQICNKTTDILAHQMRDRVDVKVCLNCANTYKKVAA